jgi:ribosomal protein S27E
MAYVECVRCGLTAFTVAYWSSTDYCGRCGAELPHPSRGVTLISQQVRSAADFGRRPAGPAELESPPSAA